MVEVIRHLTRPILTLVGLVVISTMYIRQMPVPTELFALVTTMLVWWFKDRTGQAAKNGAK